MGDDSREFAETYRCSFIIKISIETGIGKANKKTWRGSIVLVPGGEQRSLVSLHDITDYVANHLELMGVDLGTYRWLHRFSKPLDRIRKRNRPA